MPCDGTRWWADVDKPSVKPRKRATPPTPPPSPDPRLAILVGYVVTIVWILAAGAALISDRVIVLEVVTPPFLIVVGFLFGRGIVNRPRNGESAP